MPWQLCQAESDPAIGGVRSQSGVVEINIFESHGPARWELRIESKSNYIY